MIVQEIRKPVFIAKGRFFTNKQEAYLFAALLKIGNNCGCSINDGNNEPCKYHRSLLYSSKLLDRLARWYAYLDEKEAENANTK